MFRRRLAVRIIAFLAVLLVLAPQALAAVIPFDVYIDGTLSNSGDTFVVQKNTMSIRVYDTGGANHTVKVGSTTVAGSGGDYLLQNYPLKAGTNKVSVSADTYTNTYNITYLDEALPGANYYLSAIPSSGTITSINKTLTLKFPKNNYIVKNPANPQVVSDQGLNISVAGSNSVPGNYHQFASPVYTITPTSADLNNVAEHNNAAVFYPGELTLKYDPNISSAAADTLTVIYVPYSMWNNDNWLGTDDFSDYWNDTWSNRECVVLGGSVNASARTITVPFSKTGFGTYAVFNVSREFSDLGPGTNFSWSRNYVLPLWAKGVMEQAGGGNDFGVDDDITREEFTAALVKGMGLPLITDLSSPFSDVPADLSVSGYVYHILTAARNGIIYGFDTNEFKPGDPLTREQAATIVARLSNLKVSDNDIATAAAMKKAFHDYTTTPEGFSPWASPYVYAAYKAGLISGIPVVVNGKTLYDFEPATNLTRSQAAKLIYVLMKKQKRL